MKKINFFLSSLIIALVFLVVGSATLAPAMQLKSMSVNAASAKTVRLFDDAGHYTINNLDGNAYYEFFGFKWYLVKITGNVATFWMVDPYTKSVFDSNTHSGNGIYKDGANIWTNGYTETIWNSEYTGNEDIALGSSYIRQFLIDEAVRIIDNKVYASYKDKVISGTVVGSNEPDSTAYSEIKYLNYAQNSPTQIEKDTAVLNQLKAYYNLGNEDRLWLPSIGDLRLWGVLDSSNKVTAEKESILKWSNTYNGNYAWLRNGNVDESCYAEAISSKKSGDKNVYFHSVAVGQEIGVRPAIHLDITNLETEYQEHLDSVDNSEKNWFTKMWDDDWLKAMFMVVCILGVIGVTAVIIAVVAKARRKK